MRRIGFLVLALEAAWIAHAAKPAVTHLVTVTELEHAISDSHGESDGALAKQLSAMRLTERLTISRWTQLNAQLSGHQSREELLVLADESEFLDLPGYDKLSNPEPDKAAVDAILRRVASYVKEAMRNWPNFTVLSGVTRFEGTATVLAGGLQDDLRTPVGSRLLRSPSAMNWECPGTVRLPKWRLDVIEHATVPVFYRGGRALRAFSSGGEFGCVTGGVNTADDFTETRMLASVLDGQGKMVWLQWENGPEGALAVFRFSTSVNHREVSTEAPYTVGVEGEVAVNPGDGAIYRLVEMRRWRRDAFTREYDSAVEFGPVAIGGVRLLLPVRRVAMFLTPIMKPATSGGAVEHYYRKFQLQSSPLQEYLNDVRFGEYRQYNPAPARGGMNSAGLVTGPHRP